MQRRLILMRHAKSAWDTDAPSDHERPLNKRGRRDAPRVGERLAELGWIPELVISSDATRTRQTWEGVATAFERVRTHFLPSLYGAGVPEVKAALAEVGADVGTVLILGHNPGWEEVLVYLTGQEVRLTTANAALLDGEADSWEAATEQPEQWRLDRVIRPKEL